MFSSERHEPILPFPRIPEAVKTRYSISDLALRPFGLFESDLNIDFAHTPRPFLVTEILDCCTTDAQGNKVERSFFWDLNVGTRTACLLRLISTEDQSEILLSLRCPNNSCAGELEIELTFDELSGLQDEAYETERIPVALGHEQLTLRRPTGSDQLAWLNNRFADEEALLNHMLSTLVVESAEKIVAAGELLQVVGPVMEEHDPLVNFSVGVQCPDCGQEGPCEIDLEALSLSRLRQAQFRLLATVHRLAAHYHWSEEEIFNVPYWRREYYLGLLEK